MSLKTIQAAASRVEELERSIQTALGASDVVVRTVRRAPLLTTRCSKEKLDSDLVICPSCYFVAANFLDCDRKSAAVLTPSRLTRGAYAQSSRNAKRGAMDAMVSRALFARGCFVGRDRPGNEVQFGSKNRSAKANAATEALATVSHPGAFHEGSPGAGAVSVGNSLKQCRHLARKTSSSTKRSANGMRRNLQRGQLHLRDKLRLVRSMRRSMHCRGRRVQEPLWRKKIDWSASRSPANSLPCGQRAKPAIPVRDVT
jgi:hypothetical protein